jgi:hypothetical protein
MDDRCFSPHFPCHAPFLSIMMCMTIVFLHVVIFIFVSICGLFFQFMRYAITFSLMGVLLLYPPFSFGNFYVLCLWPASNCIALGIGYAWLGPGIFGKSPNGKMLFSLKIFYLPFLLFTLSIWHITRVVSRENPYDRVSESLIIGRRLLGKEIPGNITNYVDLTSEFEDPRLIRESIQYICLPILDGSVPKPEELQTLLQKLDEGTTYIHCAQGHGRTCVVALAVLARKNKINTYQEGIQLLKTTRPGIHLNREQKTFINKILKSYLTNTEG